MTPKGRRPSEEIFLEEKDVALEEPFFSQGRKRDQLLVYSLLQLPERAARWSKRRKSVRADVTKERGEKKGL